MPTIREMVEVLNWPELKFTRQTVRIPDFHKTLLRTSRGRTTFFFMHRSENEEGEVAINHRYSNLKCIKADNDIEINDYLTRNLKLKNYLQIEEIFEINTNAIEKIDVSLDHADYFRRGRILYVNPQVLKNIQETVGKIYNKANGYSNSVFRHFFNDYLRSSFRRTIQRTTLVRPGEFSFLVKRYNLGNKKTADDFKKYLDESDLQGLQNLCKKLIEYEIFEPGFIHGLNDYFIKERLEDIIKLGRKILGLKSSRMDTAPALEVISQVVPGENISQLETVWQRYFEKYLLH